ncbi:UPF0687 protein C20orf27 homolog [Calypte anna]|uniref:UPF0687 protein C20orf27 homolog n=1 Tax=Calypte anna TaxID=9244 RepID=UPI0011C4A86E|nr:UPF0687 protein C20orf27 homolog [Calypte anna]
MERAEGAPATNRKQGACPGSGKRAAGSAALPGTPRPGHQGQGGGACASPRAPRPRGDPGHVRFEQSLRDSAVTVTRERDGSFLVKGTVSAVRVQSAQSGYSQSGYSRYSQVHGPREGVLREEVVLAREAGDGATIRVVVQARGWDPPPRTPCCLDGVRCIGTELEYDSEHSDWHGFD